MRLHFMTGVVLAMTLVSGVAPAQKTELKEMQRDLALLQDEVRSLKQSQEEKIAGLEATLKELLEQTSKLNRALAVLDTGMKDRMEKSLARPMSDFGLKVQGMQEDFSYVRENVGELNSKMSRLEQKVVDLGNAIRTMQAPPAAPGADPMSAAAPGAPPQGVTAEQLYKDAMRDRTAGNYDLALKELTDYLGWFGSTDLAPNAQFYIGEIYYNQRQFDPALTAFDAVLERFPKNPKTLDAMFMKGRTLVRLDRPTEGAEEFREIIRQAPNSEQATRSRSELKALGMSAPSTTAPKKKK